MCGVCAAAQAVGAQHGAGRGGAQVTYAHIPHWVASLLELHAADQSLLRDEWNYSFYVMKLSGMKIRID